MKIIDFILIGALAGVCGVIIWKIINRRKKGKSGECNGNCAGCSGYCHKKDNKK